VPPEALAVAWDELWKVTVFLSTNHMLCQTCTPLTTTTRVLLPLSEQAARPLWCHAFEDAEIEDYEEEEDLSLDEHLLERVSGLEEIVKRSAETLRSIGRRCRNTSAPSSSIRPGFSPRKNCWRRRTSSPATSWLELWESKMGEQSSAYALVEQKAAGCRRSGPITGIRSRHSAASPRRESASRFRSGPRHQRQEAFSSDRDNLRAELLLAHLRFPQLHQLSAG